MLLLLYCCVAMFFSICSRLAKLVSSNIRGRFCVYKRQQRTASSSFLSWIKWIRRRKNTQMHKLMVHIIWPQFLLQIYIQIEFNQTTLLRQFSLVCLFLQSCSGKDIMISCNCPPVSKLGPLLTFWIWHLPPPSAEKTNRFLTISDLLVGHIHFVFFVHFYSLLFGAF